ncbi:hypothetical protein H4R24_005065 [Coemansia sp. RSA 988]|nr:hypothetical protein H4R24_005065 [Coemansia sp. RSA 988]
MQIARRPFYATEDMHFSIAQAGNVSRDFYDVTNRLFGKTRRGKLTKLSIHCNVYNFDFDKAKWNTLDTLVICRPVGYNRLLEIISKLPLLSQLAIKILDFDNYNIGTHYRHTQQQSDKRVGFLHTNIRTLWISREPAENMANLFLAKTTELVLRLRFIEELRINQKILPLARSLLSYYCNPEFPHLANITVKKVD